MAQVAGKKEIQSIRCIHAVLNGSCVKMRGIVVRGEVEELIPTTWQGLSGFEVREKGESWFIPASNVIEVRFSSEQ